MSESPLEEARLEAILGTLELMVGGDFERRLPIGPVGDQLDAVSFGINALVSEVHLKQAKLREAYEAVAESSRGKSEFLAAIVHDFRSPMTSILATAEHLARLPSAPEPILRGYERVRRNARQVLRLIEDILDFTRVEANRLTLEEEPFSPQDLIGSLVDALSDQCRARNNTMVVKTPLPLPRRVLGDPVRLQQILNNVVGNANKFTESGTIELMTAWQAIGADVLFSFRVQDTGIGIPDSFRSELFTPFTQANHRRVGGTGLGLALARKLAQALGGDVHLLASKQGAGTTFEITTRARLVER